MKQSALPDSQTLPKDPGVYRFLDSQGAVVYVGKAKNLRRRLSQYKNAKRRKAHYKMRKVVGASESLVWEVCASDLDALLLETRLIQSLRPPLNQVGAFSFMYPFIGLRRDGTSLRLCYTTQPEAFGAYKLFGCFRSRDRTKEGFYALVDLLSYVGHATQRRGRRNLTSIPYSFEAEVRSLPSVVLDHLEAWESFFKGESPSALQELSIALLESTSARRDSEEVQELLRAAARFYRLEAARLKRMLKRVEGVPYPVMQQDRDPLLHRYRASF